MTQVSETLQKLSGGEGGIARGRGRPLVLGCAPDRRGVAAASKNRSAIFVEPGWFVHTSCTANKKGPEKQALFCWRRGWDSNEHVRAPRINNLLFFLRPRIPSKPPPSPFVPVDSASSLETWISTSNNALCESRRRSSYHPVSGLIKLLDQHLTDAIDPSFY